MRDNKIKKSVDSFLNKFGKSVKDLASYDKGELEFVECDTCRAKAGTPVLCAGCRTNRFVIGKLAQEKETAILGKFIVMEDKIRQKLLKEIESKISAMKKTPIHEDCPFDDCWEDTESKGFNSALDSVLKLLKE